MIINAERDLDPMLLVEYLEYIETLDNLGPHELSKVIEQVNRSFK